MASESIRQGERLKKVLKRHLKEQGHTYKDLAKLWACSLPTVKRRLGREEMSLQHLLDLLDWLGLSLQDLHKLMAADAPDENKYTNRQVEFLAKNPREFAFLLKLYSGQKPEQIAKKFSISTAELERILIRLEKYDLIKSRAGRVQTSYKRSPPLSGPLALAHLNRQVDRMAQFQKSRLQTRLSQQSLGRETDPASMSWTLADISKETYDKFHQRLHQMMDELGEISRLEEKTLKKGSLKTAVISLGMALSKSDDPDLEILHHVFDDALKPVE
ncbi:MAG: hypothetical protein AB7F86_06400 [Bdellovibrionales bacterium]